MPANESEVPSHLVPSHLKGNGAPIREERTLTQLEVTGKIPPELDGRFLRNGPNPVTGFHGSWIDASVAD